MSQTLNIVIRIKEAGISAIDDIVKKLQELNSVVSKTQADPVAKLADQADRLSGSLDKTKSAVIDIRDTIDRTFRSVASQVVDRATSTIDRFSQSTAAGVEQTWAKVLVGSIGGLLVLQSQRWMEFYGVITSGALNFLEVVQFTGVTAFASISAQTGQILTNLAGMRSMIGGIVALFGGGVGATILSIAAGSFMLGGTFIVFTTFLKDSTILFKRLIGQGQSALTPLERASRLVSTLDISFAEMNLTAGSFFKTVAFGIATFIGPFAGIIAGIPFINSAIDNLLAIGTRFRLQFMAFFGSARSQIALIILDARKILYTLLPALLPLAKEVRNFLTIPRGASFLSRLTTYIPVVNTLTKAMRLKQLKTQLKEFVDLLLKALNSIAGVKVKPLLRNMVLELKTISELQRGAMVELMKLSRNAAEKEKKAVIEKEKVVVDSVGREIQARKTAATIAQTTATATATAEQKVVAAAVATKEQLMVAISSLLDYEKAQEKFGKTAIGVSHVFQGGIRYFGDYAKAFSQLEQATDADVRRMRKALGGLGFGFIDLGVKIGKTKQAETAWRRLGEVYTKGLKIDPAKVREAFIPIDQALQSLKAKSIIVGETTGDLLVSLLSTGMKRNRKEAESAAALIAKTIADFFPQSPPLVGPLVKIVSMGALLPFYLAKGMISGIGSVINAAEKIAGEIKQRLERPVQIQLMSERTGISVEQLSSLDYALKSVGASADELDFAFMRINENLGKTLSDEESKKFERLGIDMAAVKRSGEPALALLMSVSDILAKYPPQSEEFRLALEAIGLTASSKIVNVLRKGSGEIKKLQIQGIRAGASISSEFAESSAQLASVIARLEVIKDRFLDVFLQEILPGLIDTGEEFLGLIEENSTRIQAFLALTGQAVSKLFEIVKEFVIMAKNDPAAAMDLVTDLFFAFLRGVGDLLTTFFRGTQEEFISFISQIFVTLTKVAFSALTGFFTEIGRVIVVKLKTLIADSLDKLFDGMGEGVKAGIIAILPASEALFHGIDILRVGLRRSLQDLGEGSFDFGAFEGDIRSSIESVKSNFTDLRKTAQDLLDNVFNEDKLTEVKATFKSTLDNMKDIFSGTDLEPLIDEFFDLFSQGRFSELVEKINATKDKAIDAVSSVADSTKQAVDTAVQEVARLGDVAKINQELLRKRAEADGNEELLRAIERQERQRQEIEEFTKLVQERADAEMLIEQYKRSQIAQSEREDEERKQQAYLASLSMLQQSAATTSQIFGDLYEISGQKVKEFFLLSKAAALAEATMNIAQAITKALAEQGILGIAQQALIAAAGVVQIGKIASSTIQGFAEGGPVNSGSGTKDDVPALLTRGEYVQPADTVAHYGARAMEAIRQRLIPRDVLANFRMPTPFVPLQPKFAEGGLVANQASQQSAQMPPIQIVNITDRSDIDRHLASTSGVQMLLNVVTSNPEILKPALQQLGYG